LDIGQEGVSKLLRGINPNKAAGPDEITARFMRDVADNISPILTFIFRQSYDTGTIPKDWSKAMVSAVYKKGDKSSPENYRPISLTCISCKIMEHVILSHITKHLSRHNIIK